MPSKNWTYCPAFPKSIAQRRKIAGRDELDFTVCARLNIGGTRGAEEGKQTGRRRQKEKQGGREAEQAGKGHGERSGGDRAARGKSETDGSLAGRGGGAIEQLREALNNWLRPTRPSHV